jgi:hypothetical protein
MSRRVAGRGGEGEEEMGIYRGPLIGRDDPRARPSSGALLWLVYRDTD